MALEHGRRRFPTTHWSVVLAAGEQVSPEARSALSALCETYWSPVCAFVRQTGRSSDDAHDLTQAFFARLLEKGDFRNARRDRGRFRTFLLTAVRHFLANQADHDLALKRGGGQIHVPLGPAPGDDARGFVMDPASGETPETIYEQRWALTVLDRAMARLKQECGQAGRGHLFDQLRPFLTGDAGASYEACAHALEMTEAAVRVAVHCLRRQFGQCLRETLAETVNDPADVDSEIEYLLAVVARRHASSSLKRI